MDIRSAAEEFLTHKRIAVTGVSRKPKGHGANQVFQRLRNCGYQVFAVNPNATEVDGHPAYPDLSSIPGGVEAVVIGTSPDQAAGTIRECASLGIHRVWMNGGPGGGSVSATATAYGRAHGVTVINGGTPLMFGPTADVAHKCLCAALQYVYKVPRQV